jgi:ABC-2 type transport system permease protein
VAILPSSLSQPEIESLRSYVLSGNPTLILEDPLPVFNPGLSPILPPGAGANPFQQRQQPQKEKGEIATLYDAMGLNFNTGLVIWDNYNPHPDLGQMQPEIVFVGRGNQSGESFNDSNNVSIGLQEVVALYSGALYKGMESPFQFTPLVKTGHVTGAHQWQNVVQRSFFGMQINRNPRRQPTGESYVISAEVSGDAPASADGSLPPRKLKTIVVADIDLISDQFFNLRTQGLENISFDNVTFVLNSIDYLVQDQSFIAMRTKRVKHRTLSRVEAQTRSFIEKRLGEEKEAETAAQSALAQAQERLNQNVAAVRDRADLDEQTKQIMVQNLQEVENRRFEVTRSTIEEQRDARVSKAKEDASAAVVAIQNRIKAFAVLIPPIPVLILGIMTFVKRRKRELEGAAASRRLRSK